jgi:hypothetical protein
LYGVQLVFNEDMARAFARAEWLDRDPRLRASIVVPLQNVEFAPRKRGEGEENSSGTIEHQRGR